MEEDDPPSIRKQELSRGEQMLFGSILIGLIHLIGAGVMDAKGPGDEFGFSLVVFVGAFWVWLFMYEFSGDSIVDWVISGSWSGSASSPHTEIVGITLALTAAASAILSWVFILILPYLGNWRNRYHWLFGIQCGYGLGLILFTVLTEF